jgi:hypothetical protein
MTLWLIRFAMCALMPRTDALPGIEDTDVDAFLRRLRADAEPLFWLGLVIGAVVFAVTPIITVWVPLPAFLLPRSLLDRHAERLTGERGYLLRQAVFLVRVSAGMCWGADPSVRASLALPPYAPDPGTFRVA